MKNKLFVAIITGKKYDPKDGYEPYPQWRETKTYWAKKDGSAPKALVDIVQFWTADRWHHGKLVPSDVTVQVFAVDTSNAPEVPIETLIP